MSRAALRLDKQTNSLCIIAKLPSEINYLMTSISECRTSRGVQTVSRGSAVTMNEIQRYEEVITWKHSDDSE